MCSHTSTIFIPDSNLSIGITLILSFLFGHLPSLPDISLSFFLLVVVVFFLKPLLFDNSLLKKLHSLYFGICALE